MVNGNKETAKVTKELTNRDSAENKNVKEDRKRTILSDNYKRRFRSTPDWGESAADNDHLWVPTSASGDFCHVGDSDCMKHGSRIKCSSCHILIHQSCIELLYKRFTCRPTFRNLEIQQNREPTITLHHWVHRRTEKGKCHYCGKSFQSKFSFGAKEIIAISCSWCKVAYHNKETCFNTEKIGENCTLGEHRGLIVPPSWIIKLPLQENFKSNLEKNTKIGVSFQELNKDAKQTAFIIKPIPLNMMTPVIIFINPKSGGNQGFKLLQKFQWLLNPRQVFDLSEEGPKFGLKLFKRVPNVRILACGGDGTVGWILNEIDNIGIKPAPAVGVLPLGTGNDLARALGWGGGYTDEPISKILSNISYCDTVQLDRWYLQVSIKNNFVSNDSGEENLPLNVFNNYFSLGVDAHIALEFHEAREAHPKKFNSRLKNKMFYGQMGGKDLLKRKWKDLSDFVTLKCDGNDITQKLKELKVHAIVFLNISSYGGGTRPWNKSMGLADPSTEDGLIEVLGLTTYQLPLLQAGGHGTCITQCRSAKIITTKTIPMQVDGEACKLKPSIINLSHHNTATMLVKRKCGKVKELSVTLENLKYTVFTITIADYEQFHYDTELLIRSAKYLGSIVVNPSSDLEYARKIINKIIEDNKERNTLPFEWCFLDACTAERIFRVDRAQENLHYILDIASEHLYILECKEERFPLTSDADTILLSTTNNQQSPEQGSNGPERRNRAYEEKPTKKLTKVVNIGEYNTICYLHHQGYSLYLKNLKEKTLLHYAARLGHKDIVRYLLSYAPSNLNEKDLNLGQTALHKAALYKKRDICGMLLARGAMLNLTDYGGNTAHVLALQSNDEELAAYLKSLAYF